ncbi:hypothetical protein AB0D99_10675 [Streptomyces sp. NPDC047971]|uniref:hypothetical protein n=1 Tax=Streptomyces sp. NPDC047971 TaxID=3154499 RepID=UPI0033D81820
MIIVYTPSGDEPEHYDARSLKVSEASIVARTIDQTWQQVQAGLPEEDLDAMRAIVWVIKKRSQPSLRFGDFDPGVEEMVTRYDKEEIKNWVTNAVEIAQGEGLTEEQTRAGLTKVPDAAADPEHARDTIERILAAPKEPEPLAQQNPPPSETPETSAA